MTHLPQCGMPRLPIDVPFCFFFHLSFIHFPFKICNKTNKQTKLVSAPFSSHKALDWIGITHTQTKFFNIDSFIFQTVMTTSTQAYGEPWYWDNRYSNEPGPFDWYQKYLTLAPIITLYVPLNNPVLVVGCGNSGTFSFLFFLQISLWAPTLFFGFNKNQIFMFCFVGFWIKIWFCGVCSFQRRHGGWWWVHRCCQHWYLFGGHWSYER